LWHDRLGHANSKTLVKIPKLELKSCEKVDVCSTCFQGKQRDKNHPKSGKSCDRPAEKPLDGIHSDVVGKIKESSLGGPNYVVNFIDEYSRFGVTICLKSKDQVAKGFESYKLYVEKFHGYGIKVVQTDNGFEYMCHAFQECFSESGISHQRSPPYSQFQNGIAERYNDGTVFATARCLLIESGLPVKFWAEAVMTATLLRNRAPSAAINFEIPFERWFRKELGEEELKRLKVFGCLAWALKMEGKSKVKPVSEKCVMVGYELGTKDCYRLYSLERNKIIIRRSVQFEEDMFPIKEKESSSTVKNVTNVYVDLFEDDDVPNDEVPNDEEPNV